MSKKSRTFGTAKDKKPIKNPTAGQSGQKYGNNNSKAHLPTDKRHHRTMLDTNKPVRHDQRTKLGGETTKETKESRRRTNARNTLDTRLRQQANKNPRLLQKELTAGGTTAPTASPTTRTAKNYEKHPRGARGGADSPTANASKPPKPPTPQGQKL